MNAASLLPTDWHGVARSKLTKILGEAEGLRAMSEVLTALNLTRIGSDADLTLFAKTLARRGGFAEPVAAMLDVHVAIYGSR